MNDALEFHREIARLNNMVRGVAPRWQSAPWLRSQFGDAKWTCRFDAGHQMSINFKVTLDDGSNLTDAKNTELLTLFKSWLCCQSQAEAYASVAPAAAAQYAKVNLCLGLIDYFLINSEYFQLGAFGLSLVTASDVHALIECLVSSNKRTFSIYEWPEKLGKFLRSKSAEVDVSAIVTKAPFLAAVEDRKDGVLGELSPATVVRYRAYLWQNDYYSGCSDTTRRESGRYKLKTLQLAQEIFPETLRGQRVYPTPPELVILPCQTFRRELAEVPTRNYQSNNILISTLNNYGSVLKRLGWIEENEVNVSPSALGSIDRAMAWGRERAGAIGRTATLPPDVVFFALRRAIEFYIEFGDSLIDLYLDLAEKTKDGSSLFQVVRDAKENGLLPYGIVTWKLSTPWIKDGLPLSEAPNPTHEYFDALRAQKGLWELLMVLFGAVQITLGTLTARRVSEILSLPANRCLDETGRYLVFQNAKSGSHGFRNTELRPIPDIAASMVKSLTRLQTGMIRLGLLDEFLPLLSRPRRRNVGLTQRQQSYTNSWALDLFCDFMEVPLDHERRRYYIRTHQLRRFFAMAFFWSGTPGGTDTLRWFLAHTDPEHLYRYITEVTPGSVLQSVKANYASELVKKADTEAANLSKLLTRHFGVTNFSVLSSSEMEEYIEDLMIDGKLVVEPYFLSTGTGRSYRILVQVKET